MRFLPVLIVAACAGAPTAAPSGSDPATATSASPPAAFPPFEPVRALPPLVANVSASSCVVVWPAETDYRASFVFSTSDGGRTFQAHPELVGTALEVASVGGRVVVLQEYVGGGVLPDVVASDDLGATWSGQGAVERAIGSQTSSALDGLALRDERTGRARWSQGGWLVTLDGGASWAVASEEPEWSPAPAPEGPCRARDGRLERRTSTSWEAVPGAPAP